MAMDSADHYPDGEPMPQPRHPQPDLIFDHSQDPVAKANAWLEAHRPLFEAAEFGSKDADSAEKAVDGADNESEELEIAASAAKDQETADDSGEEAEEPSDVPAAATVLGEHAVGSEVRQPDGQDESGVMATADEPQQADHVPDRPDAPGEVSGSGGDAEAFRARVEDDIPALLEEARELGSTGKNTVYEAMAASVELIGARNAAPTQSLEDMQRHVEDIDWDHMLDEVESEQQQPASDAAKAAGIYEMLRDQGDCPPAVLTRAGVAMGKQFGSEEAMEDVRALLAKERDSLAAKQAADPTRRGSIEKDHAALSAAVQTLERLGESDGTIKELIHDYALPEQAWKLELDHYDRIGYEGEYTQEEINELARQLSEPREGEDSFSEQFICDNAAAAIERTYGSGLSERVVDRFLDADRQVVATMDSFENISCVAMAALGKVDTETLGRLEVRMTEVGADLKEAADETDLETAMDIKLTVDQLQADWQAASRAYLGYSAESVVADIVAQEMPSEESAGIERDYALDAAATQFAKKEDFASLNTMLRNMTPYMQDDAYVEAWALAKTPEQLAELNPEGVALNPGLGELYAVAQTMVSGDPVEMATQAHTIVKGLQGIEPSHTNGELSSEFELRWSQAVQLIDRAEYVGGEEAAQAVCRSIIGALDDGTGLPDLSNEELRPVYEQLATSGRLDDYEAVSRVMHSRDTEERVDQKMVRVVNFALKAR